MGRGISADSRLLIARAYDVLEREHPSGIRRVAYALFGNRAGAEVKRLGRLLARARKDGTIPWAWINDSTRTEVLPYVVTDIGDLRAMKRGCPSYDPWPQQGVRIKMWSEKSVSGTLDPVLGSYLVPFQVHHGNTSHSKLHEFADETKEDDQQTVILYVGDHDPKGVRISEHDLPKRFADHGARKTTVKRVALLQTDAIRLQHQKDPFKPLDSDVKWYRARTGLDYGVELEAIPSTELRDRVEAAIIAEITNVAAWHRVMEASRVVRESWQSYVDRWQAPAIEGLGSE